MTPVPLELPLRPADAAAVANLIFDQAERKPLTDELRSRLASRAMVLRLAGLTPFFGSLQRDPVHPSTYYLAVDGAAGEPLLLHMALANAPTGSLFAKPLLVGRMPRAGGGPEMVINCLPFGAADRENVEKFASSTDPRFLPRPFGPRPAIVVEADRPEVDFPVAFEAFRAVLKRTGKNLAAFGGGPEAYCAGVWAAIRAGWREGYSVGAAIPLDGSAEEIKEAIRKSAGCSRFTVCLASGGEPGQAAGETEAQMEARWGASLQTATAAHEWIRQTRSALKTGRSFDLELSLERAGQTTSPDELGFVLNWIKSRGQAVQLAAPALGEDGIAGLAGLAEVAGRYGCTLSVASRPEHTGETLAAIGRATLGRVSYRLAPGQGDLAAAIQQTAAGLLA